MIWNSLEFFKKDENWGDPDKMNPRLLLELDVFRRYANVPLYVSCGTQGKHEENSEHYSGHAVDVVLMNQKIALFDVFLLLERFQFNGIGIYPYWKFEGKTNGGFHLDIGGKIGRWIGYPTAAGQKYMAINKNNLKQLNII